MTHAPPTIPCTKCVTEAEQRITREQKEKTVESFYCTHHRVLCDLFCDGGAILRWSVTGPMDQAEADHRAAIDAAFYQGMSDMEERMKTGFREH